MTHGKTYNKSPRRINHKATKSKINTGTIALERSVEQTTGGLKHFYNFILGPDATLNTEIHKNSVRIEAPNSVNVSKRKHKNQINHYNKQSHTNCRLLCHLLVILKVMFVNSMDPDQTAPLGTVLSGSTLFACMQK